MSRLLTIAFIALIVMPTSARSEVTFLEPTPYLSVADSPFDLSGVGSTAYFEDFEDGVFDLPPRCYIVAVPTYSA